MTITIAPRSTPPPSGIVNMAKRKFFQSHDPYVKYYHPRTNNNNTKAAVCRSSSSSSTTSCATMYGSAFCPPYRNKKYFVACTSNGCIAVWDVQQPSSSSTSSSSHEDVNHLEKSGPLPHWDVQQPSSSSTSSSSHEDVNHLEKSGPLPPILSVHVGGTTGSKNQVLYDLQFIQTSSGDHLLVASGDPGIIIYKWCDFEAAIDVARDDDDGGNDKKPKCQDPQRNKHLTIVESIHPITTFRPHPSPATSFGESVEINSTSYSTADGILFGAAGDAFGCYQWDLDSEKLLGTFGGASRLDGGRGHRDYLHVVKTIPENEGVGSSRYVITGGEDGNMGFWDGKERKLIEMMNVQSTMDKNKDSVTSNNHTTPTNRSFMSNSSTTWNNGSNLWVSSMETNGNWLAVCGGAENSNNTITSRSSGPSSSGFMTLWHLPTRTFTSGCVTRESLNTVV
eukprot:CAMPEP_0201948712 /NCGR_PEP_ID=MMETSP0903-20130614/55605_1 /ASSEMBLY_ACC=CAM_ASM_000552 /TAXON_ID=420261 /ORGANISM="Thalassiosira antarctica, Strain CCMP982" /LENGTH=450 /DNA_ID=CAMNT_0048491905 /DNA_START=80 /DNA_END=1428 /DNA_ORIENTATION=+